MKENAEFAPELGWFDAGTDTIRAPSLHEGLPAGRLQPKLSVLVVGTTPVDAVVEQVRAAGFEARIAAPDTATLRATIDAPPALVVADVAANDASVFLFTDRLRHALGALAPHVIALVDGDEKIYEQAFAFGARDVLSRPVPPSLLRVKIGRHARRGPLVPGSVGGYRIERIAGKGGMGTVYLAEKDGERVALKVLNAGLDGVDGEALARFRRECDALKLVSAPGVPRFIDAGRDGDAFYCVMEHIDGETLAQALERGPLSEPEVIRLLDQVGDSLERIHAAGFVHRDVKPSNVILGADGLARLVDFGLAKPSDDQCLTRQDEVLGTVAYMAPELIRGQPVDPGVDAFALGMTAFEAALGRSPIEGSNYAVATSLASGKIPRASARLPGASRQLVEVLDGLLVAEPRERLGIRAARTRLAKQHGRGR